MQKIRMKVKHLMSFIPLLSLNIFLTITKTAVELVNKMHSLLGLNDLGK